MNRLLLGITIAALAFLATAGGALADGWPSG
jgi:hypothetical protein